MSSIVSILSPLTFTVPLRDYINIGRWMEELIVILQHVTEVVVDHDILVKVYLNNITIIEIG